MTFHGELIKASQLHHQLMVAPCVYSDDQCNKATSDCKGKVIIAHGAAEMGALRGYTHA